MAAPALEAGERDRVVAGAILGESAHDALAERDRMSNSGDE
jgi:hypothetical protein